MTTRTRTTPQADRLSEESDLGFGSVVARESKRRLLNRDGSFNVVRDGLGFVQQLNSYHWLLTIRWSTFLALLTGFYVAVNTLFAVAYLLCGPHALQSPPTGAPEGRFFQAFFFSVETFATIGFGNVYPVGFVANAVMTVEALVGLLAVALVTGLIFARFSRPQARIRYSAHAVIAPYRDGQAFEFRIANERRTQIVELQATVLFSQFENTATSRTRTFVPLELERHSVVFFPLAWTIVHPITADSPLHGVTADDLRGCGAEFLVLLSGFDETFSQTVHSRTSYTANDLLWNARFANVFNPPRDDGILSIDIAKLDDVDKG
jgi:inward rectifier potassium channel